MYHDQALERAREAMHDSVLEDLRRTFVPHHSSSDLSSSDLSSSEEDDDESHALADSTNSLRSSGSSTKQTTELRAARRELAQLSGLLQVPSSPSPSPLLGEGP